SYPCLPLAILSAQFDLMLRPPPPATLFPYTTLFRSEHAAVGVARLAALGGRQVLAAVNDQAVDDVGLILLDAEVVDADAGVAGLNTLHLEPAVFAADDRLWGPVRAALPRPGDRVQRPHVDRSAFNDALLARRIDAHDGAMAEAAGEKPDADDQAGRHRTRSRHSGHLVAVGGDIPLGGVASTPV